MTSAYLQPTQQEPTSIPLLQLALLLKTIPILWLNCSLKLTNTLLAACLYQVAGSLQHTVLSRNDQKSDPGRQIVPEIVLNLGRNIRNALFRAAQFLVQFSIRY